MNVYKSKSAADYLNVKFPEPMNYWQNFLINNRNPIRNPPYRIPFGKISGCIVYSEQDLQDFFDWEHHRRKNDLKLSRYIHSFKSSFDYLESNRRFSREFKGDVHVVRDYETNKSYISLNLRKVIPRYKLSIDDAKHLIWQLQEAIKEINSK